MLARIGSGAFASEPITGRAEWFDALAGVFDLRFDGSSDDARQRLWEGVLRAHRAWETSRPR